MPAGILPTRAQMDAKLANLCEQAIRLDDAIAGMAQYTDALSAQELGNAYVFESDNEEPGAALAWGESYKSLVGNLKAVRAAFVGVGDYPYLGFAVGPII